MRRAITLGDASRMSRGVDAGRWCGSSSAATGQFHAVGAGLVQVEALFIRVPALHGGGGLLAVAHGVEQGGGGHGLGLGFPGGEVRREGVLGAHGDGWRLM